jgi:hypothetical protein
VIAVAVVGLVAARHRLLRPPEPSPNPAQSPASASSRVRLLVHFTGPRTRMRLQPGCRRPFRRRNRRCGGRRSEGAVDRRISSCVPGSALPSKRDRVERAPSGVTPRWTLNSRRKGAERCPGGRQDHPRCLDRVPRRGSAARPDRRTRARSSRSSADSDRAGSACKRGAGQLTQSGQVRVRAVRGGYTRTARVDPG